MIGAIAGGRTRRLALGAWVAAGLTMVSRPARAVDPFEIQVYDGTADAQGQAGLEVHANTVVDGFRTAEAPELPTQHVSHLTFEPSYGVRPFWEVGGYLQTALRPDGNFDFAGVKARSKLVTPPGSVGRARFGVNVEISYIPPAYDAARWGGEVRPIAAWESEILHVAVNPIVTLPLAGGRPDFEPAAMVLFKVPRLLSLGLEYYTDLGPLGHPEPLAAQAHYLFEVVNLLAVARLELNLGVGEGLTAASQGLIAKLIVGYGFE